MTDDAEQVRQSMRALLAAKGRKPVFSEGEHVGWIAVPGENLHKLPPPTAIVGYTGTAEQLCTECVRKAFAVGDETVERALNRVAKEMRIKRKDECSYDSSALPKPLTRGMIKSPQQCGGCYKYFGLDPADFRRCPDDNCGDFVTNAEGPGTCVNCGKNYDDKDFEESAE